MKLKDYYNNQFSQCGQDGAITKIFDLLDIKSGYCVEFGAWDGTYLSNTRKWLSQPQWSGCLIEADIQRFQSLKHLYNNRDDIITINKQIALTGLTSLDIILADVNTPKDFELLSIDIDGDDYHIWNSLKRYSPKVVLIETNPYLPFYIEFVQKPESKYCPYGASALSIYRLGQMKGYKAVAYIGHDWLFVRNDLFSSLKLDETSFIQLFLSGVEIRDNAMLSVGQRLDLPTGLASVDHIDIADYFSKTLRPSFNDAADKFNCLTCPNDFIDLI